MGVKAASGTQGLTGLTGAIGGAFGLPTAGSNPIVGAALQGVQGTMQLIDQGSKNLDTSSVGREVVGTNDMSRSDILNTNVSVDAQKTNE